MPRPRSIGRWPRSGVRPAGFKHDAPFLAGDPFERVSDLVVTIPPAKGLSTLQRRRVLAAADKLVPSRPRRTSSHGESEPSSSCSLRPGCESRRRSAHDGPVRREVLPEREAEREATR